RAEPALDLDALAPVVAVVPPHGSLWYHEAGERGCCVAPSHRARLPLLDAAASYLARMVRPVDSPLGAPSHDTRDPCHRAPRSLALFGARAVAPGAVCRVRTARVGPDGDSLHGQPRAFHAARERPMHPPARRLRVG